jgi:hypothetical protein
MRILAYDRSIFAHSIVSISNAGVIGTRIIIIASNWLYFTLMGDRVTDIGIAGVIVRAGTPIASYAKCSERRVSAITIADGARILCARIPIVTALCSVTASFDSVTGGYITSIHRQAGDVNVRAHSSIARVGSACVAVVTVDRCVDAPINCTAGLGVALVRSGARNGSSSLSACLAVWHPNVGASCYIVAGVHSAWVVIITVFGNR